MHRRARHHRPQNKCVAMQIAHSRSSNKKNKSDLLSHLCHVRDAKPYGFDLGRAQTTNWKTGFTSGNSQSSCCRGARSTWRASWKVPRRLDETSSRKTPERKKTNGKLDTGWMMIPAHSMRAGRCSTNQLPSKAPTDHPTALIVLYNAMAFARSSGLTESNT